MLEPASRTLPPRAVAAAGVFLVAIALQLTLLARANSCTWDEADHTYAGYLQWKGDFGLNPEHPPLVKFLATLPLLDMHLKTPPLQDRFYRLQEAVGGRDFLFQNDANAILWRARLAAMPLTLLLAVLVFATAREMFGTAAGLIALGLIAFDPTLLAHSALVTTDAGQACFMLWTIYAFYRYAGRPAAWRLIAAGCALGLALAAKHSAVLLLPMLALLALTEATLFRKPAVEPALAAGRLTLALLAMGALALAVLWSFYGFHYAARPDGLALNPPMAAELGKVPSALEGHILGWIDRYRLLPQSYTYGFAHVLIQSKAFTSYLLGTIYPHPVWFYFPIAILIKSSLTFLILAVMTKLTILFGGWRPWREILYLLIPAIVYLVFAMAGGMNIGVRHVLPIYIFFSILIGGAAAHLIAKNRRWLYAVIALLVFQAVSVLHVFPAYVSYANEAAGGPANVHNLLSDSSSDWGQQLKDVKRYTDRTGTQACWFAYFGQGVVDYRYYGIPCKPLITADSLYFDAPHDVPPAIDGPVLMSAAVLSGFEFGPGELNPYRQFQRLKPVAAIDDGVFVYRGHFDLHLAAALSHVQKSGVLLAAKNASEALAEAQQAEALAPGSAGVNAAMGQALDANGRPGEARPYFQKALDLAETVEPAFQTSLAAAMQKRLAAGRP